MIRPTLTVTIFMLALWLPASPGSALNLYKPGDAKGTVGAVAPAAAAKDRSS
jgi:hypothetical protein